jgi:hypothetical protein
LSSLKAVSVATAGAIFHYCIGQGCIYQNPLPPSPPKGSRISASVTWGKNMIKRKKKDERGEKKGNSKLRVKKAKGIKLKAKSVLDD